MDDTGPQPVPPAEDPDLDTPEPPAPEPDAAALHPVALYAHFGIATPYGATGLSLDIVPAPWLGLEGGVGTNFDSAEFAFMPRIRFGPNKDPTTRFTLGAGASYLRRYYAHQYNGLAGGLRLFESLGEAQQRTLFEPAYFANFELGLEVRKRHLAARVYGGYSHLVNSNHYTCTAGHYPCESGWGTNLLYLGGSVGYAF